MSLARRTLHSSTVGSIKLSKAFGSNIGVGGWGNHAGHLPFWQEAEAGVLEHDYLTRYGSVVRWKGPLGVRDFFIFLKKSFHSSLNRDILTGERA